MALQNPLMMLRSTLLLIGSQEWQELYRVHART